MKKQKFDDFDPFATRYREEHTKNVQKVSGVDSDYFSEYKIKEIRGFEEHTRKLKILDLGCGDGNSAKYFLQHFMPEEYCGIDISSECIELACQRSLENSSFQTFDGEIIPFEDETFDLVFIANVLHHVDFSCHQQLLGECLRVLKKEGRIYIFEHNPLNPVTRKIVKDCIFDADAKLVPSRYLRKLVHQVGFSKSSKRCTIFFPRKSFFLRLLPLEKHLYWCPLGGQYYLRCIK
jgi:ubiquinone/menaquinone biosynthesis C-methylase UbiE